MTGLELAGQKVNGHSFRGQYLNYETFERVRFADCDFSHVDAKLASFRECEFVDCKFDNGNYQLTTFSGCSFVSNKGVDEIRNASFGGARFSGCKIFTNCAFRFKECSFRRGRFDACKFGQVSFRTSSVESSEIRKCSFVEIDIAYASCSGLVLDANQAKKTIFSTPTFFLVVGGWNLITSSHPVLRNTIAGEDIEDVEEPGEIRAQLAKHLASEINSGKSIWRIAAGLVSLSYQPTSGRRSLDQVVDRLVTEIRATQISEEQLLDELILTLKLFFLVELFDEKFAQLCGDTKAAFDGISGDVHPDVWEEYIKLFDLYRLATQRVHRISFQFEGLSAQDPNNIRIAADVAHQFRQLVPVNGAADNLQIREGSVVLEVIASLNEIPWWIAVAITVGFGSKVTINFDINELFSQIGNAISSLRSSKQAEIDALASEAAQHEVKLVITDVYLEQSNQATPVLLPSRLTVQGSQGEGGIQLAARVPGQISE